MAEGVADCARMVNASKEPWIVWCELNDEGKQLQDAIPESIQVAGADDNDVKESRLLDFSEGRARVLISKSKIAGWGLNWQHCANVAFVGATDSFESYYQSVRRCWRFGQTRPVNVHIFASRFEGAIVPNLKRKEADAIAMAEALSAETRAVMQMSVLGLLRETNPYAPSVAVSAPSWLQTGV